MENPRIETEALNQNQPTPISLSGEQHTQPKIQYGGGFANYRLMVKIRQLNVSEPYFRPITKQRWYYYVYFRPRIMAN